MIKNFIYVHIMKTAGTSLSSELKRIYKRKYYLDTFYKIDRGPHGILDISKESEQEYPNINYKKYNVIHGHITINKYQHLGWPAFTFLRNPIDRVISHYSSARNFSNNPLPIGVFCEKTENMMNRMTSGDLNKFFFVGIVERYEESLKRFSNLIGYNILIKHINKTRNKLHFNKKQLKIVKKYNQKDLKLYEQALNMFDRG